MDIKLKCRKTVKTSYLVADFIGNAVVEMPQESPLHAESEGEGLRRPIT